MLALYAHTRGDVALLRKPKNVNPRRMGDLRWRVMQQWSVTCRDPGKLEGSAIVRSSEVAMIDGWLGAAGVRSAASRSDHGTSTS